MNILKGGKTKGPKLGLDVATKFEEKSGEIKVQFAFTHKSSIFNAKGRKADKTYLTDVVTINLTEHIDAYRAQVLKEIYDIDPEPAKKELCTCFTSAQKKVCNLCPKGLKYIE